MYTLGKRGQTAHFKVPELSLQQQGIDIQKAGRGGETTFHGPGQIVLYPVVNLRRLGLGARAYVEALEDCMVDTCSKYGIQARVGPEIAKRNGLYGCRFHTQYCLVISTCLIFASGAGPWQDRCMGG